MSGDIETVDIRLRDPDNPDGWIFRPISVELVTEHLAITPCTIRRGDGIGFRGDWQITHVPTGLAIPRTDRNDVDEVEDLALRLSKLKIDWSFDDVDKWRHDHAAAKAVVKTIEAHSKDWGADE